MIFAKYISSSGISGALKSNCAATAARLQQTQQRPTQWNLQRLTSFRQTTSCEWSTWSRPFQIEALVAGLCGGSRGSTTNEMMKRRQALQVLRWNSTTGSTISSVTSNFDAATTSTTTTIAMENDDIQTYNELMNEYYSIINNTVPKLSLKLYRTIMRSIYTQVQHGNQYDDEEFTKREEKQRQQMEHQEKTHTWDKTKVVPEMMSLIDTLPINREDELQSRKNYYVQYTRENFVQNSDLLQEIIQPINREKERKKNFNYNNSTASDNGRNNAYTHEGPIQHNYIQYTTRQDEQYDMIQRWIHVIQQGYIHHEWLLRDMKFSTTDSATTATSAANRKLKKNRIQTHLSKVNLKKQQDINAIQLQIQQYVDKVLQYNYNISDTISNSSPVGSTPHMDSIGSVPMDPFLNRSVAATVATTTMTMDMDTASVSHNPSSSSTSNWHANFEWSDDEDDN